jgi:hypothetical protein
MTDMDIGSGGVMRRGEVAEEYPSRDLNHQTSGCNAVNIQHQQQQQQQQQQQLGTPNLHHTLQQGGSFLCYELLADNCSSTLIYDKYTMAFTLHHSFSLTRLGDVSTELVS